MARKKRRKLSGRWCWCCGDRRPNESFSRKRRVCRQCAKLGREEIAYRQHVRDIDRLLTHGGQVRATQQRTFAKYLAHDDPRVRAYAEDVRTWPERERALEATAATAEASGRVYAEQMGIAYEEEDDDGWLDADDGFEWAWHVEDELPF